MSSLNVTELTRRVVRPGGLWRELRVVARTGSTNSDLLAEARAGAAEGLVLVAETQTAGRGRLGRPWVTPPRAALTFSVLLRPAGVPPPLLGWVPLLAGTATAAAVRTVTGVPARLKWPNDVLAGTSKLAGILAESWAGAVVVGVGINVSQHRAELPVPGATSLLVETMAGRPAAAPRGSVPVPPRAGAPDHGALLAAVLDGLARRYTAWRDQDSPGDAGASGLRAEYLHLCATLGRCVTVTLPGGDTIAGTASGVDPAGRLEVLTAHGTIAVSAGDVTHVR
jgi:BirA family biotin operon repressor/biotin-[acetyl-CoA-carboxylase] ligase